MSRAFFQSGETMVSVKGNATSSIASLSELGMVELPLSLSLDFRYLDIRVDAFGQVPPELQFMLALANASMPFVHFDLTVLKECIRLSMGGAPAYGQLPRAGTFMGGNGAARFAAGYNFIGLNMSSPVGGDPWRFLHSHLSQNPIEYPIGAERTVARVNWRAIPYVQDPYNSGDGSQGVTLFDNTLDT